MVDSAVVARTSVATARLAALTTYARRPETHLTTTAVLHGLDDGSVDVALAPESRAARRLQLRPLASVRVAPQWCEPVALQGTAERRPGLDGAGRVVFHVHAGAVRVGHERSPVCTEQYRQARPDPLRDEAGPVLSHLNAGHTAALAACLRARGVRAGHAEAAALDAHGLTLLAVTEGGVSRVRLAFPHPVATLDALPGGLRAVLQPGCGCCCADERDPTERRPG